MQKFTDNSFFEAILLDDKKSYAKKESSIIGEKIEITLKEYQAKSPNNTFLSFFKDEEKRDSKNEDDLIISIKKDGDSYHAQRDRSKFCVNRVK